MDPSIFDADYETVTAERVDPEGEIPAPTQLSPFQRAQPATAPSSDYEAFMRASIGGPPRDEKAMIAAAKRIGELLGPKAFYSFPAGGGRIEGASIDLAYALVQTWGRCLCRCMLIQSEGNRVMLRGQFVDLHSVSIVERDYTATLSPPPGRFANKPDQADRWRVMQEQSAISKAVRGAILGGLPAWYVAAALDAAFGVVESKVLKGKTLVQARADAAKYFTDVWKLSQAELEAVTDKAIDLWTTAEIAALQDLAADLKAGRTAVESIRAQVAAAAPAAATNGRAALGLGARRPEAAAAPAARPNPTTPEASHDGIGPEEAARIQAQERAQADAEQASRRRPRGFEEKMHALGWPDDVVTAMPPVTVRVCVEQHRHFGEWILTDDGTVVRRNGGS